VNYVLGTEPLSSGFISIHDAFEQTLKENHSTWKYDSPAARDVAAAGASSGEMTTAYEYVLLLLASASHHLRAIADLLAHEYGFFPNFTLARVTLEAAARAWYLMDPDIEGEERLRRYLNERLSSLKEQLWLLSNIGDETADKRREISELLLSAEARGYPVSQRRGLPPSVGEPRPTAATLIHQLFPDPTGTMFGKAMYQVLSSVVHGAAHGLTQELFETAGPGRSRIPRSPFRTIVYLAGAPMAFLEAAFRAFDQFGWDATQFRTNVGAHIIILQTYIEVAR
jgi:hypothetical protein